MIVDKQKMALDEMQDKIDIINRCLNLEKLNSELDELKKEHFPFIYYMTWSKEFCLTEKYNSNKKLKEFYSDKSVIKEK